MQEWFEENNLTETMLNDEQLQILEICLNEGYEITRDELLDGDYPIRIIDDIEDYIDEIMELDSVPDYWQSIIRISNRDDRFEWLARELGIDYSWVNEEKIYFHQA